MNSTIITVAEDILENGTAIASPKELSVAAKAVAILIYSCLSILAIGGNSIVVFIILYFRRLRTATNLLILNLAVADLLISLFCMPLSYWPVIILDHQRWPFGRTLCPLLPFLQGAAVFLSSWTLVAISFDRFTAIVFLMKPQMRINTSRAALLIALTWIFSVMMALPILLVNRVYQTEGGVIVCGEIGWTDFTNNTLLLMDNQTYSNGLFVLQYCIPLTVLVVTYAGIGLKVWNSRAPKITRNINNTSSGDYRRIAYISGRRDNVKKMLPMMILISLLYGVCWLPQNILMNILVPSDDRIASHSHILYVWWAVNSVAMSHSVVNPLIYCWRNGKFREAFLFVLSNTCLPCIQFRGLQLLVHQKSQAMRIVNMVAYAPVTARSLPDDGHCQNERSKSSRKRKNPTVSEETDTLS